MWGQLSMNQEAGSTRPCVCQWIDLGLHGLQNCEECVCCFSHPVYGIFIIVAWTKMIGYKLGFLTLPFKKKLKYCWFTVFLQLTQSIVPVIHICTFSFFHTIFHHVPTQETGHRSLCLSPPLCPRTFQSPSLHSARALLSLRGLPPVSSPSSFSMTFPLLPSL